LEEEDMYYVDLPWYVIPIWIIAVLAVFLPLYGIPAIGIAAVIRALGARKAATASSAETVPYSANLGLTMADGGEKLDEDSDEDEDK
jgi:hypothetical protein